MDPLHNAVDIGSRLELFVDKHIIASMNGTELRMHQPQQMPLPEKPLTGSYMTVIKEEGLYRGYYRRIKPHFSGQITDGNRGECTCYVESKDGINWDEPDLGLLQDAELGTYANSILDQSPFAHNFSPFRDQRPGIPERERYKALAGTRTSGLHAFASPDGIHWHKLAEEAAIPHNEDYHGRNAFDSQNVSFWSEAEGCYVAYFRHFNDPNGSLRTIGRAVSSDFRTWEDESPRFTSPLLPEEQLYTNQTHPYFRAPHIYIALPTRFTKSYIKGEPVTDETGKLINKGSTDVMLMATRAGSHAYERLFTEAFIRPGLDPAGWENRAYYLAQNVVPTAPGEMSLYNRSGHRYVLRTDGFVSINAPYAGGELVTKPLWFSGSELVLNLSTAIRGGIRVELQDAAGTALPGFGLNDCRPILDDSIAHTVTWQGGRDLQSLQEQPVRIRFELKDSDIYSLQFR